MVEFGRQLATARREEWNDFYLDYDGLKSILKRGLKEVARQQQQQKQQVEEDEDDDDDDMDEQAQSQSQRKIQKTTSKSHSDLMELRNLEVGGISDHVVVTSTWNAAYSTLRRRSSSTRRRRSSTSSSNRGGAPTAVDPSATEYLTALEFRHALDQEIEKLVLFLLQQEGVLATQLYALSQSRNVLRDQVAQLLYDFPSLNSNDNGGGRGGVGGGASSTTARPLWQRMEIDSQTALKQLATVTSDHQTFAQELLQYVEFVELNVTGLRKILKKHDKNFPHYRLSARYFRRFAPVTVVGGADHGHQDRRRVSGGFDDNNNSNIDNASHLDQLYHYGGLNALFLTLRRSFDELHQLELNLMVLTTALEGGRHKKSQSTSALPISVYSGGGGGTGSAMYGSTTATTTTCPSMHGSQPFVLDAAVAESWLTPVATSRKEFRGPPTSTRELAQPPVADHRHTATIGASGGGGGGGTDHPFFNQNSSLMDNSNSITKRGRRASSINKPFLLLDMRRGPFQSFRKNHPMQLQTKITKKREPILDDIRDACNNLQHTTQYAELVAAQAMITDDEARVPEKDKTPASDFTTTQKVSSFLNLCSTFLYMTNYYVVAPTVGDYAEMLGTSQAMAGIIIGMTPNAALVATFLYGWWSNHSYRHALIFAATCCALGNIFYAMALQYNSLPMVMVGRFLNGFGSARSINRRYIADAFSKADRTAASANFVSSGALGMAAGPAIAFVLGNLHFAGPADLDFNPLWCSVTAPGWIMLGLWSIFLIAAALFFVDPDRSHLYDTPSVPQDVAVDQIDDGKPTERQPLLIHGDLSHQGSGDGSDFKLNTDENMSHKEAPLYKNIPVMMTLWLYFVLKLELELLLSSSSTITRFYFGWTSKMSGLFLAFLGLLMFPANIVVAKLSQRYEDREMMIAALFVMVMSSIGMMDFSHYSAPQYMIFAIGVFISTNSLESPNMGLLTKTIPKSWARGIFNSGFLSTEAGTLARSVGDILITSIAGSLGMGGLLNGMFVPMTILSGLSLLVFRHLFNFMIEADEDDTASLASTDSVGRQGGESFGDYDANPTTTTAGGAKDDDDGIAPTSGTMQDPALVPLKG